jgi:hypothetical protein
MFQWAYNKKLGNIVILDKNGIFGDIHNKNRFEIILTPSFYWFTKKNLPIKFTFQAKEYLPSIFEELGIKDDHSYAIVKKEDGFWLFAYSDQVINEALEKYGINPSQVNKIYFAQNVLKSKKPIDLGNGWILANIDGVLSRVPSNLFREKIKVKENILKEIELKNGVELKRYTTYIDEKTVKKLILPIFLLTLLYLTQTFILHRENQKLKQQKDKIFSKYKLLSTAFQNRAVLKSLQNQNNTQDNIRRLLSVIFSMPLLNNEYIQKLDISAEKADIIIKLSDKSRAKILKNCQIQH